MQWRVMRYPVPEGFGAPKICATMPVGGIMVFIQVPIERMGGTAAHSGKISSIEAHFPGFAGAGTAELRLSCLIAACLNGSVISEFYDLYINVIVFSHYISLLPSCAI